jgi:predicted GNAT family acetyltransferase
MQLRKYDDPTAYVRDVGPYLEQREVVNSLPLGLAIRLQGNPTLYGSPPYLAAVTDAAGPALCALMTPPHNLLLYSDRADPGPAMALVAADLRAGGWPVPGVNGPLPLPVVFADLWQRIDGARSHVSMAQRVYELRRVIPPRWSPGHLRLAGPADFDLLLAWSLAFQEEAGQPGDAAQLRAFTESRLAAGEAYFWEDGRPVSMASRARATAHGITVGRVYTPPELRRRGYATSSVAALSQRLLDEGFAFCTLFTDLANPTSNAIYQQIGYTPVCDFRVIEFAY